MGQLLTMLKHTFNLNLLRVFLLRPIVAMKMHAPPLAQQPTRGSGVGTPLRSRVLSMSLLLSLQWGVGGRPLRHDISFRVRYMSLPLCGPPPYG